MFLRLAQKSLIDRRGSVLLTIFAISVSIFVLLGVEHLREQARQSFSSTVSGTDLIVGARTSNQNLLLYSVFRVGNATNNIRWSSYQAIASNPNVEWTIPLSLGDSHRGYRVLGTSTDYFQYYSYGAQRLLKFEQGGPFESLLDVVLGAEVARKLGYEIGDSLVLAHGLGDTSFSNHDDNPFQVVGILEATGTPVDQSLHVSLEAIEAIHEGWQQGAQALVGINAPSNASNEALTPASITAFMVGLKSRLSIFGLQREINEYPDEPLLAILPGVTLTEFWRTLSTTENTLRLISVLVLSAALLGLSALLLTSIRERRHEISVMRMLGASPRFIFLLIEIEALLITILSSLLGGTLLLIALLFSQDWIASRFGLHLEVNFLSATNLSMMMLVMLCSSVICLIPAISAYRKAL